MNNGVKVLVGLLCVGFILVIVLYTIGIIKIKAPEKQIEVNTQAQAPASVASVIEGMKMPPYTREETYLTPKKYEIGIMNEPFKPANLCGSDVLYPLQSLQVNYGTETDNNCPCMEFIKPP
jgi:hypothetical protein